jgi:hypothetical protein
VGRATPTSLLNTILGEIKQAMYSNEQGQTNGPSPADKDRWALLLYYLVNALSLLVLILLLIELLSPKRIALADVGTPMGLVLLFFAIPACWGVIKFRTRNLTSQARFSLLPKYKFVRFAWLLIWLLSCTPILFYGSLIYYYSPRPWLESNQGPDTEDSLLAFNQYFETTLNENIHGIYFQGSPDMKLFRFTLRDPDALDEIISQFKLNPVSKCHLNIVEPPKWWQDRNQKGQTRCFSEAVNGRGAYQLLLHEVQQQIYFMQFNS